MGDLPVLPRVTTIEGRRVAVFEPPRPIPPTLQLLLEGGRDSSGRLWQALRIVSRNPLRLGGTRRECYQQDHRLTAWVTGFHVGRDNASRYVGVQACIDCGATCVRDMSFDDLRGLPTGGQPLRRKNAILGWYSGARSNQRVYT